MNRIDRPPGDHPSSALVIGGGFAGLVCAEVLSGHFAHVTLLERDPVQGRAAGRRGIPQAPHQHILLARGRMALDAIFPGLSAEIIAAGVEPMDVAQELAWLTPVGWTPRFRSGITILPCSRELLEWRVRERVRANGRVEIRDGQEATGLILADSRTVVGARVRPTHRRDLDGSEVRSDLLVDASGRGSRLPRWLEELGLAVPPETAVDAQVVYSSCVFEGRAALPDGLRGAFLQAAPPAVRRGGAMLPIEGGRTLVTLIGRGGDDPPTDDVGFLAYASTLRSPLIHDAIAGLQPLSPIATSRATRNRCRHYELVREWPDGLVVLGDAACAFNPVYGQGMSTAVLGAAALGRRLGRRRRRPGLGSGLRFQHELAGLNAGPWALDTALDLRVHGVTGPAPGKRMRARQAYLARVARLGTERRDARLTWLRVFHMLRPPSTLLRPGIAVRVMLRAAGERRASRRPSRAGPPRSP